MKRDGTFVLVECNGGYGREYARRATALGLDVVVLSRDPEPTRGTVPAGTQVRECDTRRVAAALAAVSGLSVVGVLAGYEGALPAAAALAAALGLPGPSPAAALDTFHKPRARALANSLVGNPVPCWLLSTVDDVATVTGYPVVAKPAASGGSIGVAVLHNPTELAAHATRWLGALDERGLPELVEYALGIDQYAAAVRAAIGEPVRLAPSRQASAAIRFLTADRPGTIARIAGIPAATAIAGVTQVTITAAAGAEVHPAEQSGDRLGHLIATGPTAESAAATADAARRHIRIEFAIPAAA